MMLIVYAHPYSQRSHINKTLLAALSDLKNVEIHSLYESYPDFNIDVFVEQEAVNKADTLVMQHPMQWYGMPSLMKLWIDRVFEYGWAYGAKGNALQGKNILWVVTTGGNEAHFRSGNYPEFDALSLPLQKTALYCGMNWLSPFVIHDTFKLDDATLRQKTADYRRYLMSLGLLETANEPSGDNHG